MRKLLTSTAMEFITCEVALGSMATFKGIAMNDLSLRRLGIPPQDVWADLVRADPTALVFQTPEWLRCMTRCGWKDASRLYETRDGRLLVLPLAARPYLPGRASILGSLPAGWGTGGLVALDGVRPHEVAAVVADLAGEQRLQVRVRPTFLGAPAWEQTSEPLGRPLRRKIHALDLSGGLEQVWAHRFRSKTRQGMRAAQRRAQEANVNVRSGHDAELVSQFYELFLTWTARRASANGIPMQLAQARARIVEPRRKYAVVASELGDRCRIRVASLEGRSVAATMTLLGDRTSIYWRGCDDRAKARSLHVIELLHLAAIEEACDRGHQYYEMGESGNVASLEDFKVKLGGIAYPVAEYRLESFPLSRLQDSAKTTAKWVESVISTRLAWRRESKTD